MITRDLLVDVLSCEGDARLTPNAAGEVAERCLAIFTAEADRIRQEILQTAAERISPSTAAQIMSGAPWDLGFHDGKAVAADALRLMARQY